MTDPIRTNLDSAEELQDALFKLLAKHTPALPPDSSTFDSIENRLQKKINSSIVKQSGSLTIRARAGKWQNLSKGIRYKMLRRTPKGNSVLIELAPNASLPVHRHAFLEEGIVLSGELHIDDQILSQGSYHVSQPGSHHDVISTPTGGVAYLRGSSVGNPWLMTKELLGKLLPPDDQTSISVALPEGEWQLLQPGLYRKYLWQDTLASSVLYRADPNINWPVSLEGQEKEIMIVQGELFIGDLLLQAGDFHVLPKTSGDLSFSTDCAVYFFVRAE